jgi:hypothetical protein
MDDLDLQTYNESTSDIQHLETLSTTSTEFTHSPLPSGSGSLKISNSANEPDTKHDNQPNAELNDLVQLVHTPKYFIKLFIITYNNDNVLNRALDSLFSSDFINFKNTQVNIINNYSSIKINDEFLNNYNINIIHNQTRGDNFNPNLSQNHNQAIIFGFNDLNKPESDIVIHTHNDIVFHKTWVEELMKCMEKYTFVVGSIGDQFVAYKADAIKKIGLWDENFPGLIHKEGDYMLRAFLLNKEHSYVNDRYHGRLFNCDIDFKFDQFIRDTDNTLLKDASNSKALLRELSTHYFCEKWKNCADDLEPSYDWLVHWNKINLLYKLKCLPHTFKLFLRYPFFECNIQTLKQQNYLLLNNSSNDDNI